MAYGCTGAEMILGGVFGGPKQLLEGKTEAPLSASDTSPLWRFKA